MDIPQLIYTISSFHFWKGRRSTVYFHTWCPSYNSTFRVRIEVYWVVVKSFVGHFSQRAAIRMTWGRCHSTNVKVVFVLGYSKLYEEITREEYINNEDVIQFSFLDTYRNHLPHVILIAALWEKCPTNDLTTTTSSISRAHVTL
jgi:hypothetical protein